jgi:hypothetical protein
MFTMARSAAKLRLAILLGVALATATACTGTAAPPTAAPPTTAPSASADPGGSPTPAAETYWLRMTTWQAIPPLDLFAVQPVLVITGSGIAVAQGPVPAIYPGPLLPNLVGRSISGAGEAAIVRATSDLGLIGATTDFTGQGGPMGAVSGRLELTVDGSRITITGNPDAHIECITTPCEPQPGTPEAFGELWRRLLDLPSWLAGDLGPEAGYVAPAYALLVGPPPKPDPTLPQGAVAWPLDRPVTELGRPVANGTARCGTISGADADALRPSLAAANQLTPWIRDPATSVAFGLVVRPLTPGEDACAEVFGS